MDIVSSILVVVFGLIIGSFLNVVIYRVPRGLSIVHPGSRCPGCSKDVRWFDNIPVLSYLLLRGKCRDCQTSISPRYAVVEALTALLFLAAKMRFGVSAALILRDLPFLALLIAIAFIDLDHRIIPDPLSLGGLGLGLLTSVVVPGASPSWLHAFIGAAIGFGVFFALASIYQRMTGRFGLGGGDVKLLAMIGAYLGPGGIFATILISSVFGSIVGLFWAWWTQRKQKLAGDAGGEETPGGLLTAAIPYGPFLVVGAIYYYLLGDVLWFQFTSPM